MLPHFIIITLICIYAVVLKNSSAFEITITNYYYYVASALLILFFGQTVYKIFSLKKQKTKRWKTKKQIKRSKIIKGFFFIIISAFAIVSVFFLHTKSFSKNINSNIYYAQLVKASLEKLKAVKTTNNSRKNIYQQLFFKGIITKNSKFNGKYYLHEMKVHSINILNNIKQKGGNKEFNTSQTLPLKTQVYLSKKYAAKILLQSKSPINLMLGSNAEVNAYYIKVTENNVSTAEPSPQNSANNKPIVSHYLSGYYGYLLQKNIFASVYYNPENLKTTGKSRSLFLKLQQWQRSYVENKAKHLNALAGPLSLSLITGEKNYISKKLRNMFLRTGTYHTLVISGMHIGLLLFLIIFSLRLLRINFYWAFAIAILVIPFTLLFLPFHLPVLRAYFMAAIAFFLYSINKRVQLINIATVSFIVFFIASPFTIYSPGFQFSFASVFAIAIALPFFKKIHLHSQTLQTLVLSWLIFLATLPTSLMFFQKAYPAGIFYNLFIPPLVMVMLLYSLLFYLSPVLIITLHFASSVNFIGTLIILLTQKSTIDNFLPQTISQINGYVLLNISLIVLALAYPAWALTNSWRRRIKLQEKKIE